MVFFIPVLCAGVVSKGNLFFMISQMKPIVSNVSGTVDQTYAMGNGPKPLQYRKPESTSDSSNNNATLADPIKFVGFTEKASVAWHW